MEVAGRREGDNDAKQENKGNERECEACNGDGVTTKADGVCLECEEFMCKKCFKDHLRAKQCRNHVFDNTFLNTVPFKKDFEVEKCKRHAGELIKFYCRKHEIVGCGECMIPDHFGCSPENIKDLCKEFRCSQEFASLERSANNVECSVEANSTKIKEHKNANAEMYKKALNGIKQFRKDINNYLDTAEETILKEAKEVLDANDTLLTLLEKECMLQSSRIAEVSGQLNPDLYAESGLFIQTVTLKSIIKDMQQALSLLRDKNNIKEFKFDPDKQLQRVTKSLRNFGKICCSPPSLTVSKVGSTKLPEKTPNPRAEDRTVLDAVNKKKWDCSSKTKIVVGSRVRASKNFLLGNGTVTHVDADGTVTVQWDGAIIPMYHDIKHIELI